MNVTHEIKYIENHIDKTRGRLVSVTYIEGKEARQATILSGPAREIRMYMAGEITLGEITERWGIKK